LSPARKPPTIFEIAALFSVSKSTVSNVIRGVDGVSAHTRERVLEAVDRLGYRPNALARQIVAQRTTMLGVLVGDLDNPFYAEMAKLIERWAFRHGYTAMFCNIEGDDHLAVAGVEGLLEQRVAGIVFLAFFGRSPAIAELLRRRVPVVFVGLREDWGDSVAVSDGAGARLATEHLIGLGHERIATSRRRPWSAAPTARATPAIARPSAAPASIHSRPSAGRRARRASGSAGAWRR
jgi:DNA-binding LacI/PurR family transcriptional regulator